MLAFASVKLVTLATVGAGILRTRQTHSKVTRSNDAVGWSMLASDSTHSFQSGAFGCIIEVLAGGHARFVVLVETPSTRTSLPSHSLHTKLGCVCFHHIPLSCLPHAKCIRLTCVSSPQELVLTDIKPLVKPSGTLHSVTSNPLMGAPMLQWESAVGSKGMEGVKVSLLFVGFHVYMNAYVAVVNAQ